ncbi:7TM diverse intracellular signaling domain-containing protein [Pseudomonas sp. RIT-PI-S]|uniref:hybrid sensor histidine kinase/response regulator n=1 Tax=Pseudomonas sp. RIT-PI-S TaxID=3035295 RepID=UPI0021D85218|nr:7TM diverse intracellular signaling domain-containing protein [Pseudomonas sp. RIT-PI-S]
MRYILLLLLCWLPSLATAIDFDDSTRNLPLGQELTYFEDKTGAATLDQVLAQPFRANTTSVLNAGYSSSAFWLKADLRYLPRHDQSGARTWLLELAYPPMDHVDLYLPDGDGGWHLEAQTGDELPWASRPIRQNNYVFNLAFKPGEARTVLLRVQSEGSVQVPLSLWSAEAFLEAQPERFYVFGLIYGVLLVMLVYNLFIYLSVRDTSYLYYILYIASFGLYQVSVNGAGIQFFWPNNPWWANAATPFLIGAAAFFGCQFSRTFLRTAKHGRWLDRLLKLLMGAGVVVMAMSLMAGYGLALRLATALALVFTVVIFSAGITAWLKGQRQARYFMIAWSAFLLGGIVNTLMVLGLLPNMFLTMYASQLGSALEVALLSLALADRINAMREQQAQVLLDAGHKLEVLNQQLSESNRLKDEFLATVTHELRTPMNGVIGSLELMQTVPMNGELTSYQQTASRSARDMMRMVDDILILTELQAGRLKPRVEPFRLQVLLDSLHMQFIGQANEKGLALRSEVVPGVPDILRGDLKKMALCLGRLLDNAIKFTREGSVTLAVEAVEHQYSEVRVVFRVIDTGIGLSLPGDSLYQQFYQVDGSMTREHGGLGIGLAICRQLATLLDGTLSHQSTPGQGSCFELAVSLGVEDVPVIEPVRPRPTASAAGRQPGECTVVLIESERVDQLVIRGMLLRLGYQVRGVVNEIAAVEALRSLPGAALLLDGSGPLPALLEQVQRLRQSAGAIEFGMVAVIDGAPSSERQRCLDAGLSAVIARPVRFETFQALLAEVLLEPCLMLEG